MLINAAASKDQEKIHLLFPQLLEGIILEVSKNGLA